MKKPAAGFALVLALVLLGIAGLMFAGLVALAGSQAAMGEMTRTREIARQHALFALNAAIAQLQEHAGPDQRVTAVGSADGPNPRSTGVWDSRSAGPPLAWLISNSPDSIGSVELVGLNSSGRPDDVRAPAVGVDGGHYAWWVGDENGKAALADSRTDPPATGPFASVEIRRRIRQQLTGGAASADGNEGPDILRQHFWSWTSHASGLVTDPLRGGFRQDLAHSPELLGPGFRSWADYSSRVENPLLPSAPGPAPAYGPDPLRRRFHMSPGGAPVLTYFLLTFNLRTTGGSSAVKPIEARARWMMTLWNPSTAAFVPENLRLEVSGLPDALQVIDDSQGGLVSPISLPSIYGNPMRISLPWDATMADPERQSWLPGRLYTWTALENLTGVPASAGFPSRFNSRNLSADGGQGVEHKASEVAIDGDDICHLAVAPPQSLLIRLYTVRAEGDGLLATFHAPVFAGFSTTPRKLSAGTYQFSYLFRLAESFDTPGAPETWLATPGLDLRAADLPATAFTFGANGNRPELYENYVTISSPDRLLDRAGGATSYNEDVPVFESPRAPLLTLGTLQHLPLDGARAFSIGNPWGASVQVNGFAANSVFDRFYLSDAQVVSGAFNVNSTEPEAWSAVLRGTRYPAQEPFSYLDASSTGTAGDSSVVQRFPVGATFFRYAQSAQETAKAEPPVPGGGSVANTQLFRRGWRELGEAEIEALAVGIAQRNTVRLAAAGPWRSLEEFVDGGSLGQAIDDASLNKGVDEFSAQWLTAADILTPLAPYLFVRSDRFVIRAYGDAAAERTGEIRARAWLEAEVQRTADYVDPGDPPGRLPAELAAINAHLGRRFRIVSFRWLASSDI